MAKKPARSAWVTGLIAALSAVAGTLVNITAISDWMTRQPEAQPEAQQMSVVGNGNQLAQNQSSITNNISYFASAPSSPPASKFAAALLGTWETRYQLGGHESPRQAWKGRMTFLSNGKYTYFGECEVQEQQAQGSIQYTLSVAATGHWTLADDRILMEHLDVKSHPRDLTVNGQQVPASMFAAMLKLENAVPAGNATEYVITALDAEKMSSRAVDVHGRPFEVIGIKRS